MRELFVSNNQLSGDLAPIRRCVLLQELFLGDNELTGDLEPISACTRMEVLSLDDNKLTGGLEPLQACKGVRTLYLAGPPTPPTVMATNRTTRHHLLATCHTCRQPVQWRSGASTELHRAAEGVPCRLAIAARHDFSLLTLVISTHLYSHLDSF